MEDNKKEEVVEEEEERKEIQQKEEAPTTERKYKFELEERLKNHLGHVMSKSDYETCNLNPMREDEEWARKCVKGMDELEHKIKNSEWQPLYSDPAVQIESWYRTTDEGLKSMMAVFDVECKMEHILSVINNNEKYRKIYDPSYHSGHALHKVNDSTFINYTRIKKVSFISGREFILLTHWAVKDEKTVLIVVMGDESLNHL